ncbi:MAG: glycerate kinase [Conexibacter sp.]|nr:glycerate kinase [Conexibacter sp.]
MARILVAPDSFKGTFSAAEVAEAIARGARRRGVDVDRCPAADGGEGTLDALLAGAAANEGETAGERLVPVHDPLGRPLHARLGLLDGGARAVVETAQASGLGLVAEPERDAERASTRGTGELIVAAVEAGARELTVTVGGSATSDGGAGALDAIAAAGGLRGAHMTVLCDVTTPFERAAEVYGPQKGADPAAVARLTARLHALADELPRDPRGVPMTGAAGGLAGGLWAAFGAELVAGAPYVLDLLRFDRRARAADAVVTGEGRLDAQSLAGKLVGAIAERGGGAGVPVHAFVGCSELSAADARALGLAEVVEASTLASLEAAGAVLAARLAGVA